MKINFFENIISKHIINTYNKSSIIENLDLKSFFWHSFNNEGPSHQYIFFAIVGNVNDGNIFIPKAIENGYKIIVSDSLSSIEKYKNIYENVYFICVNSIQALLDDLAVYGINNYYGKKIAITGSAGKTTTTYLLNNILKNFSKVTCTDKYNSQYYLRRLLFHLFEVSSDFLITELSSDHIGMIENYSRIIKPDYSIITSFGNAHIEDFKSIENIIKEKTSIIPHTVNKVFIPAEYRDLIINEENVKNYLYKIEFVENNFIIKENKVEFKLKDNNLLIKNSELKGKHNYSNMNLVLNLLEEFQMVNNNKNTIINTLEHINPFPGRGNIIEINKNNLNYKIICEYHNSNSISFKAALSNISNPTLVIMGFMYDLGNETSEKHYEILNIMEKNPHIKYILAYDKNLYNLDLKQYNKLLIKNLNDYENFNNILKDKIKNMNKENVFNIFIKGSRSSKLELVIKDIFEIIENN